MTLGLFAYGAPDLNCELWAIGGLKLPSGAGPSVRNVANLKSPRGISV